MQPARSIYRSFSKEQGRNAYDVAALSVFPQIEPAKINLSLFGRLLVHVAVDVGGDLGGDMIAA